MNTLHSLFMLLSGVFVGTLIAGYLLPENFREQPQEVVHLQHEVLVERTEEAEVRAEYPKVGIPFIDERIEALVAEEIALFKEYASPIERPDTTLLPSTFELRHKEVYLGENIVSVVLPIYTYTGGAHGGEITRTLNFYRDSGEPLTLEDALLLTGKTLEELSLHGKTVLTRRLGEEAFFEEGAEPDPENFNIFSIREESVVFYFPEYQVAAYAAGGQTLEVSRVDVDNK